ncbi:MAG: DJ-1/PfpI family protein [Erysipelotrichaceae bacterium]|nr:DJ-1/PfpI family protein [Erysipelotrichaceae bacterium]
MKILIFLADGFETVEALLTLDLLTRSHRFEITTVSISGQKSVASSIGVNVEADALYEEIDPFAFDAIILPGGKKGVDNLKAFAPLSLLLPSFLEKGKDVHAICAAPSILGSLGLLNDLPYTCFPGFECGEGHYQDVGVVETAHIITGHSMGYTMEFASAIIRHYYGEEAVKSTHPGVYGLR